MINRKKLPSEQGIRQFVYEAHSQYYTWSTFVTARTIQEARRLGFQEAHRVFGNHAPIHRDTIREA